MKRIVLAVLMSLVVVFAPLSSVAYAQPYCLNNPPREIPQISMANEPGGIRVVLTTQTEVIHHIDYNWSTRRNANPGAPNYNGTTANFFVSTTGGPWYLAFNGCAGAVGGGGHWYKFVGSGS